MTRNRRAAAGRSRASRRAGGERRPLLTTSAWASRLDNAGSHTIRVPVLADGADPGRRLPSPLAIRERLLVDRRLVGDHPAERLFAYDITTAHMKHLRGVAAPGDRVVFRRGGRVSSDRICAVRTPEGIVLARVVVRAGTLVLLPGDGGRPVEPVAVQDVKALPGVIAGTQVLLIRR